MAFEEEQFLMRHVDMVLFQYVYVNKDFLCPVVI